MEKQKIRTTLFRLLIIILMAGMVQDALAQRKVLRSGQRNDQKRSARTTLKKDKIVKQSGKQTVRKSRIPKSGHTKAGYSKNEQRKRGYQDSKKVRKDRIPRTDRKTTRYTKKDNRKNLYRDSKKAGKSYNRDRKHKSKYRDSKKNERSYKKDNKHAFKHRVKKRHYPSKKKWHHNHYRKPAWVDYHRPGYRYPRIGMHVSILPHGYFSLQIGHFRFYAYRGVYYCYDPALRVYVVVNKPRIETWYTSVTWDRIIFVDGSTIEGAYLYTDNDMVIFEVGDALLEIPMSEIKLLSLA